MKRSTLILLVLVAVSAAAIFFLGRGDRGPASAQPAAQSGPSGEMMAAMHRMHETANKTPMTGDLDRDFVALMVPHHLSAVEMARIYLQHGKDPELRRLSENIVASQEAEIRRMNGHGAAPAAGPVPAAPDSSSGH
jgi:hypothetical protein